MGGGPLGATRCQADSSHRGGVEGGALCAAHPRRRRRRAGRRRLGAGAAAGGFRLRRGAEGREASEGRRGRERGGRAAAQPGGPHCPPAAQLRSPALAPPRPPQLEYFRLAWAEVLLAGGGAAQALAYLAWCPAHGAAAAEALAEALPVSRGRACEGGARARSSQGCAGPSARALALAGSGVWGRPFASCQPLHRPAAHPATARRVTAPLCLLRLPCSPAGRQPRCARA